MTTVQLKEVSPNPDFSTSRYVAEGSGMDFFILYTGNCFVAAKYYKGIHRFLLKIINKIPYTFYISNNKTLQFIHFTKVMMVFFHSVKENENGSLSHLEKMSSGNCN